MNTPHKDKPSYWQKKFANMRKAKALRKPSLRSMEMREEERSRLGIGTQ